MAAAGGTDRGYPPGDLVTGGAVPPPMFQAKAAVPVAPMPSVTVTVTVLLPDAVGVPEISPLEALIASPAGRPVAE